MALLKSMVYCSSCERQVEKNDALLDSSFKSERRFLCFTCYKMNKQEVAVNLNSSKVKKEYFCAKCKYKFKSLTPKCPYCGKSDSTDNNRKITAEELLM